MLSSPKPEDASLTGKRQRSNTLPALRRQNTRNYLQVRSSVAQKKKNEEEGNGVGITCLYIGIAAKEASNGVIEIGLSYHDGTYSIGYGTSKLEYSAQADSEERSASIADYLVSKILTYEEEHLYKFLGAGLCRKLVELSPELPSRLWSELDIVSFVFDLSEEEAKRREMWRDAKAIDEEADSMARKCLLYFGPINQPRLMVGHRNDVEVDCGGQAQITRLEDYPLTVGARTWEATVKYAESLKERKTRLAFFSSTPQGGGVALMRHALLRLLSLMDVDCKWYVPNPKPEVFRITKNNHNILQGVAASNLRLTEQQKQVLDNWSGQNASRVWTSSGEPLAARSNGGADVIIVDDPQMPALVRIAKEMDPSRPVIFRSHIQVRADLADQQDTPTAGVWNWVWEHVKGADVFISHPVSGFVPEVVPARKVGYMPATTDWLDGLNKAMGDQDIKYYMHQFQLNCFACGMNQLQYPERLFIVQIARFDPAKGIPHVLASYAELRRTYMKDFSIDKIPQLVIAGHGAIDDPDATIIYDQTMLALTSQYSDIQDDVVVMRLGPTDQLLNVLMSTAYVALQLSTREGFEVKVSEALHKGMPIIATRAGGIPLQVEHGKSGYLVEPGDSRAVAKHLYDLFTDSDLYGDMCDYAKHHVSDEVGTVGNALCWLYLADSLARGDEILPDSRWIYDMAREQAGLPHEEGENRLPRSPDLNLGAATR